MLMMFNLDIEARLIEKLIDLADQARYRHRLACQPHPAADAPPPPSPPPCRTATARSTTPSSLSHDGRGPEAFDLAARPHQGGEGVPQGAAGAPPGVTAAEIAMRSRRSSHASPVRALHRHATHPRPAPLPPLHRRHPVSPLPPPGTATSSPLLPRDRWRRLGKADRAEVLRLIKIYAPSSRDEVLENVVDFGDGGQCDPRAVDAPPRHRPSPSRLSAPPLRLLRRCRSPSSPAS